MARQKQATPLQRATSSEIIERANGTPTRRSALNKYDQTNDEFATQNGSAKSSAVASAPESPGLIQLLICVGGIYASFLSWAVLQERITTTTTYGAVEQEKWTYSIVLNTVQSSFAAITGYIYFLSTTTPENKSIFPNRAILAPLVLVAITSSLASPFGYASLKHIDYITFILAKSCKLLPVMALHLTIFRKRYPLYKYAVVALVTAGVAIFTLHHPSASKRSQGIPAGGNAGWGLFLLGINLLFDGLTNSTQDHIFQTFRPYSGPQMMCAQNILCTALTAAYLAASPYLVQLGLADWLGMEVDGAQGQGELAEALSFIARHPGVGKDVLAFAACGAVGQLFIYYTLSNFSSLLLVTVTVTRKMLTMMLSVVWFGHRLSPMQWLGVGLVFGGVGAEGVIQRREKAAKEKAKKKAL